MTLLVDYEYKEQRNAARRVCAKARREMAKAEKAGDKVAYHKASRVFDVYRSTDRK